jgi:charged multivesicular body protein 7
LTSRFIGRPLWWAVSQLNPFGSSEEVIVKEDSIWAKYAKGKEYVHIPILVVCPLLSDVMHTRD